MFTFTARKDAPRKSQRRERRCLCLQLEGLENRHLLTGIIRSPVAVLQNTGGDFSSDFSIKHTIDQSGLSSHFMSGVTDFDAYLATNPIHTLVAAGNEWFPPEGVHASTIVYDMGAAYTLDRLALWNEDVGGIATMAVSTSDDPSFGTFTAVGTFNPTDTPNDTNYSVQVFNILSTTARYVRLEVTGPQSPFLFDGVSMGEIAFSTNTSFQITSLSTKTFIATSVNGPESLRG